ncbi:serine/threonine-protein kinase VRK1-like [Anthonomus grandis grandis]|uniref:serine/threonine-protein kinase VRK1-like n=1 Tax=Anthonomus grandis grandis TaxID=2921223 RepID=UPI002165E1DD|nr:serine/threonine-protein kinase VRK1-like [Anthonomus grandis grandis]
MPRRTVVSEPQTAPPTRTRKHRSVKQSQGELKNGEVVLDNACNKWKLGKTIGIGGFGEICEAVEYKKKNGPEYVAKIEKHTSGPLFVEINCYLRLGKIDMINKWRADHHLPFLGMPHFVASGSHHSKDQKYRFLILPKYHKDLEAILKEKHTFNYKTVLVIASRIIDTLEYIHSQGYVHCDIKASNIMLAKPSSSSSSKPCGKYNKKGGRKRRGVVRHGKSSPRRCLRKLRSAVVQNGRTKRNLRPLAQKCYYIREDSFEDDQDEEEEQEEEEEKEESVFDGDPVYLLDYGLAKKYILTNGEHRELSSDQRRAHAGTVLFCSRDAHKGMASRRSDLESLAYNMIYWLTGSLPWIDDLKEPELVEKMKNRSFADLRAFLAVCFMDCPRFMVDMLTYIKQLQFMDKPNYDFVRALFKTALKEYGYKDNAKLDFDNLEGGVHPNESRGHETRPHCLLNSPLTPLSPNVIFKRPKLRNKIKDKVDVSMMNWSKILVMDPETIIKQAPKRCSDEDKGGFALTREELERLNPTRQMREVFNRAVRREGGTPPYGVKEDFVIKRPRRKRAESPPHKNPRTEEHPLKKIKTYTLKRTYSLRG